MSLSTTVKSIQDIMRKDAGVDGDAQRISQLVWMLFLKIFDDREQERELMSAKYRSPIPEKLRWRNWAADSEGITGEALLDFVNGNLFKTLKDLPVGSNGMTGVIRTVFEDAYNYMKSGQLMRQVINKLNEIDFNRSSDRHQLGDIYEQILSDLRGAGNAGEIYTPRGVTQFVVDQIDPKLGETVLDPACGTGGFLTCAIEHVRKKYVKSAKDEVQLQKSLWAYEKKPLPHLLCTTNMILHGIDVPSQIRHDNTLARPLKDWGPKERVDVVVTNPPFGGMEEDGIENNFPTNFRTRETADLFLAFILHILKPGGRAAVVLPDGSLYGEGVKTRLKEKLFEECNFHTIIRLPNGVFSPYTDITTNILFFEKGGSTKHIWYYEHPYPPGYKSYSKTKPLRIEEFEPEKKWWTTRRLTDQAWKVAAEEVAKRAYNLDIKNPNRLDDSAGDADSLERLRHLHRETASQAEKVRHLLRSELASALARVGKGHLVDVAGEVAPTSLVRRMILDAAVRGWLTLDVLDLDGASEGPFRVPQGWRWRPLGDLAIRTDYGTSQKADTDSVGIPVLRMNNIQDGRLDVTSLKYVPKDTDGVPELLLRSGDLLFNRTNSFDLVGKMAVFRERGEWTFASYLIRVRLVEGEALPEYVSFYFGTTICRRTQIEPHITKQTNQANFNGTKLKGVVVPLPPLAEQKRIVAKVEALMKLCDELEAKLKAKEETAGKLVEAVVRELVA